ncbi:MAG TPA: ABC transporter substrate-binding protein, partial [Candidatus Dormibacteraeota bacterium]|nr:ABC transporter substrate-binding protein [Candidatus Dormibacteraeota bacterium]
PKDPLTPEDVKFSLDRAARSRSPLALALRDIQSIDAVGSDLIKIKLKRANPNFLATLATSIGHITSKKYFESLGRDDETRTRVFNRLPIGTGPYRMTEPLSGSRSGSPTIVLERFGNYHDTYWARSNDAISRVTFRFYEDPKAILKGIVDGDVAMTNLPLTEYGDGINVTSGKGSLTLLTPPFLVILAINTTKPPLDDLRVRQLLNAAVYTPKIMQICHSDLADMPPGFQYYMKIPQRYLNESRTEVLERMLKDPATQRGLDRLRTTGITILAPDRPDHVAERIIEAVASDFRANLGIASRIEKASSPSQELVDEKKPDLIYAHWTPDTPWEPADPSILKPLFESRSRYNLGRYADAEVDRLFQQIRVISDPGTTEKNYHAIQTRLLETAPLIWLPSVRHMTLFLKNGYEAPYAVRPGSGPSSILVHFTSMVKDVRKLP